MGPWNVPVTVSSSAYKHGITRDEIFYAIRNAQHVERNYGRPQLPDGARATLFIGPSRFGTLEVLATITPPDGVHVFHAMQLREVTRAAIGYQQ